MLIRLRMLSPPDPSLDIHFASIIEDAKVASNVKSLALSRWGRRLFHQGRSAEARNSFSKALRLIRRTPHRSLPAQVAAPLAFYHFTRGFQRRADRLIKRLGGTSGADLAPFDRAMYLSGLGAIEYERGNVRNAFDLNLALHELARTQAHVAMQANATTNLGLLLHHMHHPADSRRYLSEGLALSEKANLKTRETALLHLAEGSIELGRIDEAEAFIQRLLEGRPAGVRDQMWGMTRRTCARIRVRQARVSEARELFGEALNTFVEVRARDEWIITRLDQIGMSAEGSIDSKAMDAFVSLAEEARSLGQWRVGALVEIARVKSSISRQVDADVSALEALAGEALSRGFVTLEIAVLQLLVERLVDQGWMVEARAALSSAMTRIKVAAGEFSDPELRSDYLSSGSRHAFRELAGKIRGKR